MMSSSNWLSLLVVIGISASSATTARAGIYNVQSILATEADPGLSGAISGSADYRSGNVDYVSLTAGPVARYSSGNHLIIGLAQANYKTSNDTTIISRFFEHLRYRYSFNDRVLGEVYGQHEFDGVKRLRLRALVGAGPKVELLRAKSYGLDLGVSYMLEYEALQDDGPPDSGATYLQHRNSTYAIARYELDDRVQLIETAYYQPRLTGASDYRVLNETQISFSLTKRLSFATSFNVSYDSRPPNTIKRLDKSLTSTLTFQL